MKYIIKRRHIEEYNQGKEVPEFVVKLRVNWTIADMYGYDETETYKDGKCIAKEISRKIDNGDIEIKTA